MTDFAELLQQCDQMKDSFRALVEQYRTLLAAGGGSSLQRQNLLKRMLEHERELRRYRQCVVSLAGNHRQADADAPQ